MKTYTADEALAMMDAIMSRPEIEVRFSIHPDRVLFLVGRNVLGSILISTYRHVSKSRITMAAKTFRDFAPVAAIEDAIRISRDALLDAGLIG